MFCFQELGLPIISLAATEVVSGVSGESERTLRDLFQVAKEHAPCVLFIDDVDSICRKRDMAQREMERRIVTQLLACMDGQFLYVLLFASVYMVQGIRKLLTHIHA